MVAYAVVALIVLRNNDYRAALIIGIVGFAIHAVELLIQGTANLGPLEIAWVVANTVLPLALVWLNWILIRRTRYMKGNHA